MLTKKLYKGICAIALAFVLSAVSLAPIFDGIVVPVAEAAPSGSMPMYGWGSGAPAPAHVPARIGTHDWIFTAVASGGRLAVRADGTLHSLGASLVPTQIGTQSNWLQVSARSNNAVTLNSNGQIFQSSVGGQPVQVGTGSDWVSVVAGNANGFAINEAGELWTWGTNAVQLGREVTLEFPAGTPGRVGTRTDWVSISAGASGIIGVTESGELWSWGNSGNAILGRDDSEAPDDRPGRVGTATNWVTAMTTNGSGAAINSAGELYSWGTASDLGRPVTLENPADRPGRVGTATNWVSVHGGNSHFLAFNTARELWGWGSNAQGQLGLAGGGSRATPALVLQTFGFSSASRGGGSTSLMLLRSTPAEGEGFITKDLQMPYGTPAPDLNFTFTITAHSFNGDTTRAYVPPVIPNRVITIDDTSDTDTNAGITTLTGLVDALAGIEFTHSGVFSYTVQEQQNTSGATSPSTVTYSQAQYRLNIYVQRDWEASGEVFEIVAVTVYRHINDNGTAVTPPEKVEDGLLFTNQYRRTTSGTTEYPGGLRLTKTVVGEFADRTTPFDFDVTLTRTAMCPPTSNFQARIYNADGTLNSTVPITSGVSTHLTLRHRQSVIFQSTALAQGTLTIGTGFTITERAAANFVASVELYVGDNPVTIPPNSLPNTALSTGARIIGDNRNSADFTNAHLFTPPVGLSVTGSTAPFVLVALAILLMAVPTVAISKRKGIEEEIDKLPGVSQV